MNRARRSHAERTAETRQRVIAAVVESIELEEFQVKLPGDLEIQRFFGELEFDRLTGDWEVGFGGRAAFPDVNVMLGVPDATISSSVER